ncbi:ribonuclease H-like domain-containing protein, partial [Tanacetum coccineum]
MIVRRSSAVVVDCVLLFVIMSLHGYSDGEYDDASDVDNVTLISKLDVSHPLHLHPNDYVALTVVFIKLKGTENYQVWSCAMLLALEGKNKIRFIDGSCRRSNTYEVLGRHWDRVNVVVLGWILNSISEELFLGQIFSKRAKHVWDELKETYDKVDGSVTFSLHHKIHTLSQNGSSIADYYHKLNALWKQFDALIELPRCTCHAADDFNKHNQLIKLMQFLMGLDDTYMQIRSSILSRENLPDVRSAYAIISSEESHRIATGSVSGTTQRKRKAGSNLKGKIVSNNVVGSSSSNGFYDEQMATLISLIKENLSMEKEFTLIWQLVSKGLITDSGANQHITYTDKNLIDVIDISNLKIKVTHPNGTEAFITRIGNMPLIDYLTLYDVLVVPEYCVSLMSVHKVSRDSKLVIAFDEMHCYVMNQDWRKGKILGTDLALQTCHPADQVLDVLKPTLNFDNKNTELICDTCQRAKQTREHFPLSDHVLTELGELVHLDLWGPYKVTSREGLPTSVLNGKSPYDLVYNKHPSLNHLRSFGCLTYATFLNSHDKFRSRSEKCVLVGYSNSKKGYKLWSLDNKQIIYLRDVKFFEDIFPFKQNNSTGINNSVQDVNHLNFFNNNTLDDLPKIPNDEDRRNPSPIRHDDSVSENRSFAADEENNSNSEGNGLHDQSQDNVSQDINGAQNLRRSSRTFVFPKFFNNFVVDSKVKYGLEKYVNYSYLSKGNYYFATMLNKGVEPKTYLEASQHKHWVDAMNAEMNALYRNNTWEIADHPVGRKAIGIDFDETFSPVVKIVTVRCLINLAVQNGWSLFQMDINNAFLYGDLEEIVYMALPPGYFPDNETKVCKLNKSLYGLKHAPRQWNAKLTSALLEYNFVQSKSDYSLFIKSFDDVFIALLVYVDDIIITGNNTPKGICLNQRKYCLELIDEFGLLAGKPSNLPMQPNISLTSEPSDTDPLLDNVTEYQKLIGKLIYLTTTRPDIAYTVSCLSQFMHNPLKSHLKTALKVIRYLKGSPDLWFLGKVKKQNTISKSSVEAEYRALASVTSEVISILKILKDLKYFNLLPVKVFCDSNSAIKIAANPIFHERTKHLEIDLHFIREKIVAG